MWSNISSIIPGNGCQPIRWDWLLNGLYVGILWCFVLFHLSQLIYPEHLHWASLFITDFLYLYKFSISIVKSLAHQVFTHQENYIGLADLAARNSSSLIFSPEISYSQNPFTPLKIWFLSNHLRHCHFNSLLSASVSLSSKINTYLHVKSNFISMVVNIFVYKEIIYGLENVRVRVRVRPTFSFKLEVDCWERCRAPV